jgi:hypothetical protein
MESTQQGLIDDINQQAEAIHPQGHRRHRQLSWRQKQARHRLQEIRGTCWPKPDALHTIGLMPFVRHGVRHGERRQGVQTLDPLKNKFAAGENQAATPSISQYDGKHPPQNIYEALLIRHIDPNNEIAVLENGYETLHDTKGHRVLQEDYELTVIKRSGDGWVLERKIIIGRTDLKPRRQFIYTEDGKVATDAKYADYKDYDGFSFPSRIEIYRPQEEYDITLNMLKVEINAPLKDEQFVLEQPAGAQVVHLDRPQSSLVVPPDKQN